MEKPRLASVLAVVFAMSACSSGTGTTPAAGGVPALSSVATPAAGGAPADAGDKRRHPDITIESISVGVMYAAPSVAENAPAEMAITLTNGAPVCSLLCTAVPLTGVGFKIALPQILGGQFVSTLVSTTCPNASPMASGLPTLTLSNATLTANGSCTVFVKMSSPAPGEYQLSMPPGTITSNEGHTNLVPGPNPPLYVTAPLPTSTSQNHLYVPVRYANTIDVYATGPGAGAAPQYKIQSTAIVAPTLVTVNPTSGEVYVYNAGTGAVAAFPSAPPNSTGTLTEAPKTTHYLGYAANGMAVDSQGRLVVAYGSGNAGPYGGFWYSDFGTNPLNQVGYVPSLATQRWTTTTSGGRFVYFGDTTGSTVSEFETGVNPPLQTQPPVCTWSVSNVAASPFQGSQEQDTFYLGFGSGMLYYAVTHPRVGPLTPSGNDYDYSAVDTTAPCKSAVVDSLSTAPPGYGNGLTLLDGIAVNAINGTFAVSTVPNYDTVTDANWVPDLESWVPFSGTLTNTEPNGSPPSFVNSGAPKGSSLGQPSYGP